MLELNERTRMLVVGAHPDDEALGCGGLIARVVGAGGYVGVAIACNPRRTDHALYREREQAYQNAAKEFGFRALGVSHLPHEHLLEHMNTVANWVSGLLDDVRPSIVVTQWQHDTHQDHRGVFRGVEIAMRSHWGSKAMWMCMETISATEAGSSPFWPNLWVEIATPHLQKKMKGLECYHREIHDGWQMRSGGGIEALAKYRGLQIGAEYAEAFVLMKRVVWLE